MNAEVFRSLNPASIRLVENRGPSWKVNPSEPFACFTSTAASSGPIPYLYRRYSLSLPAGLAASARAVEALSYRVVDQQGKALWVLNCTIPASPRARVIVAARFNLYPAPDDPGTTTTMDCTIIEEDGDCQLAPVHAGGCGAGWYGDYPDCYRLYQPQCGALDPGCGGFGGGDPGDGGSGGGGSCTDCGPSAPMLTCSSVTRGESTTCAISDGSGPGQGTGWKFTATNRNSVTGPDGASWSGRAVLSGTVSAVPVSTGSVLQASLTVRARGWRWGSAQWSYSPGTAALCETRVPGYGLLAGWNLTRGNTTCIGDDNFPIQPDPRGSTAGQRVVQIQGGPNNGLMFVDGVTYRMDRESNQNPNVQPGGQQMVLQGADASACGSMASFYEYNRCRGVDMAAFLSAVWAHEGNGTTGNNGHYSLMTGAASLSRNDPYASADNMVSEDWETLTNFTDRVREMVWNAGMRIHDASADDSGLVTGNWSGTVWLWDYSTSRFGAITMSF